MESTRSHRELVRLQSDSTLLQHHDRQGSAVLSKIALRDFDWPGITKREMATATFICVTLRRMATKKLSKSHTSTRKKRAAPASRTKNAASSRTKKAATKATKSAAKSKPPKPKKLTPEQLKKRMELTMRVFQYAYEANQRGEFWRF
jgi:uncharacterized protein with WD repeat